ncbi:MAG: hypothetical protein ABSG62_23765 [Terracidiphilus sp.]|jgi:hypothetical protein
MAENPGKAQPSRSGKCRPFAHLDRGCFGKPSHAPPAGQPPLATSHQALPESLLKSVPSDPSAIESVEMDFVVFSSFLFALYRWTRYPWPAQS